MSKVTDEMLLEAIKNSFSFAGVIRYLGLKQAGGTQSHYKRRIINSNFDVSHFTGQVHNRGKSDPKRKTAKDILLLRTDGKRQKSNFLVRALLESNIEHKCSKCGMPPEWMGNKLTLEVDHINENWLDDRLENLRFLCPNCHSQFSRKLLGH